MTGPHTPTHHPLGKTINFINYRVGSGLPRLPGRDRGVPSRLREKKLSEEIEKIASRALTEVES